MLELLAPQKLSEGFQVLVPVLSQKSSYFSQFVHKRGDVGPRKEQGGYIQDARYFHDYADIQRFGLNQDFCRGVVPENTDESETFFACALGGTKDVSTLTFRTNTVKQGLKLSRDDYMRDIIKDGRAAYCRILKSPDGSYQPMCRRALDFSFSERDEVDPDPPAETKTLLSFYDGCVLWLRLRDDMNDYMKNITVQQAGDIKIDETPRPEKTQGLVFDGSQKYLRIGDSPDLTLGSTIKLRSVRAFSIWVFMDSFANNSHFFDFGDGAGHNNVFLGILGHGDPDIASGAEMRPLLCGTGSTLPDGETGAQFAPEMTPQKLMETTGANVDKFVNVDQEVNARVLEPSFIRTPSPSGGAVKKATLIYEVWDQRQRKVSIKVNSVIPLKKWTHIAVTAITGDAARPDLGVFVNGEMVHVLPSGYLPQAPTTSNNYIGKSNWANDTSTYELRDELFHGHLFDFRMYKSALSEEKIKNMIAWGKGYLASDVATVSH
jgi:hypothetical protein